MVSYFSILHYPNRIYTLVDTLTPRQSARGMGLGRTLRINIPLGKPLPTKPGADGRSQTLHRRYKYVGPIASTINAMARSLPVIYTYGRTRAIDGKEKKEKQPIRLLLGIGVTAGDVK